MTTLSLTTPETRTDMLNENHSTTFNSGNINNQHQNDGNESNLIEEPSIPVTKELFLCRICYNYDQIERFVNAFLLHSSFVRQHYVIKVSRLISV